MNCDWCYRTVSGRHAVKTEDGRWWACREKHLRKAVEKYATYSFEETTVLDYFEGVDDT